MPTPTLEEAIYDLTEAAKTAEHHGSDAHDVPPESIRVVLAALRPSKPSEFVAPPTDESGHKFLGDMPRPT